MNINFMPPQDIEEKAIGFLSQYHKNGTIPIPIEALKAKPQGIGIKKHRGKLDGDT